MKWTALLAASMVIAGPALAQTDVSGSSNTPSGVKAKPGAMTIRQASGGGKPHAPRTGRQPTARPADPSQGSATTPRNRAHATTSKGMSGVRKSATQPAQGTTRR